MNDSDLNAESSPNPVAAASDYLAKMDDCVHRNPTATVLFAVGAGLAIGLLVRALRPDPTPQGRLTRMLSNLENRLRDVSAPILRKANALKSDGIEAAHEGATRAKTFFSSATRRVRGLFS